MLREALELLAIRSGGTYVDATVGLGGHASEILKLMGPGGRLIGIDRDDAALREARQKLPDDRVFLEKGRFSELKYLVSSAGFDTADGILFDLGVSMMQFKEPGRGFSFSSDETLDMRMDKEQRLTAEDIVNRYPERELEEILRYYGEERFARKIAKAITSYRTKKVIGSCSELADIVTRVCGRGGKHHPATRTFQALRIAVNDELGEIRRGLEAAIGLLAKGGRLCAISYHSLEDRTVKNVMREAGKKGAVKVLTKKPLTPSRDEIRLNRSARSAKLRGAERI